MVDTNITVFIVNDQKPIARLWEIIINSAPGLTCVGSAYNGTDAVEQVLALQPDIVLMDVMMPGIHGYDATRAILSQRPEARIIIYSAHTDILDEAVAAGAVTAVAMPLPPDTLVDLIRRVAGLELAS